MARRRKKRKSGKSKSIPMAIVLPPAYIALREVKTHGLSVDALDTTLAHMTGFKPSTGEYNVDWAKPFWLGEIAGIVVHKVANKTGVNRHIRKLTMGYLSI